MASQNNAQSSLRTFLKISVKAAFLVELYSKIDLTKYFTNDTNIFVFTHCYSDFTNFSTLKQFAFFEFDFTNFVSIVKFENGFNILTIFSYV